MCAEEERVQLQRGLEYGNSLGIPPKQVEEPTVLRANQRRQGIVLMGLDNLLDRTGRITGHKVLKAQPVLR